MSIFNIDDNINKVLFEDVFQFMSLQDGYRSNYIKTGLFFSEPEDSHDLKDLIRIPVYSKPEEEFISFIINKLDTINKFAISTQENIPTQLVQHFSDNNIILDSKADPQFIRFDNNINRTFRDISAQHELRRRMGEPGFGFMNRCAYIHFIFTTKLTYSYNSSGPDTVHYFLPVELKEGWG